MVAFGGWEMPLSYPSGTVAEHRACREHAVAFDVSHLGTVRVVGSDAFEHLQHSFSNDLRKVHPGRAQYTHLLDEDGSVIDDIIVWWVDEERFDVMPNASNTSSVRGAIGGEDVTHERAVIAVQGPEARDHLSTVSTQAGSVHRFCVERFEWEGAPCLVAGTGYTGEDGVECEVPAEVAPAFWERSWRAGSSRRASVPETRCASRRASRYTDTSSARASPLCRPVWPGSWAGTRMPLPAGRRSWRKGQRVRLDGSVAWSRMADSHSGTGPRSRCGANRSGF